MRLPHWSSNCYFSCPSPVFAPSPSPVNPSTPHPCFCPFSLLPLMHQPPSGRCLHSCLRQTTRPGSHGGPTASQQSAALLHSHRSPPGLCATLLPTRQVHSTGLSLRFWFQEVCFSPRDVPDSQTQPSGSCPLSFAQLSFY